jgi:hypothetical protein
VARGFLGWLGQRAGLDWLDAGCGTGALTETILGLCEPHAVTGVEETVFSAALRELLRRRLPIRPDGSIQLVARAWGAKGRV